MSSLMQKLILSVSCCVENEKPIASIVKLFSPVFAQVLPQFDSLLISVLLKSEAFGFSVNQFYDIYEDFRDELAVFPMYDKCLVAAVENSLFDYVLKLNVNGTLNILALPVGLMFIKKLFMHDAHFHPKILCLRRFSAKFAELEFSIRQQLQLKKY